MKNSIRRRVLCGASLSLALIFSSAVFADVGPYVGIEAGLGTRLGENINLNSPQGKAKFHDGFVEGLTVGYALPGHLRPELELDYRRNTLKQQDAAQSAFTAMGNFWYDFEEHASYFYLGGGVGLAHVKFTVRQQDGSDNLFAYQLGVGAGYLLSHQLAIGVDYRYLSTPMHGDFDIGNSTLHSHFRAQAIMLGLRYNFGVFWDPLNPYSQQRPVRVVPLDSGN